MTPSPTDLVQAFPPQTLNFPTSALYLGDNLDFMRGMNSETVSLIATDPPFNKGVKAFKAKDGTAADGQSFTDKWNWQKDVHPQWVKDIQENWPAVGAVIEAAKLAQGYDTAAYLCWLGVRLLEMHRILRNDGAIYVHLDQTAVAWVKALMDAIFGRDNSRNEIVWRRTHSKNSVATRFGTNHDTILAYSKGKWTFNKKRAVRPFEKNEGQAGYKLDEKTGRYFALSPIYADGARNGDSGQPATFRGKVYEPPANRHWRVPGGRKSGETTSEGWARLDAEGRMHLAEGGKFPQYIRYRDEMNGVDLDDVWTDIPIPSERERTGWSTQKPIALYERIVLASSKPGDVVFDPFAGCSTTLVAAEKHGRLWVGCDRDPIAQSIVRQRLSDSRQLANPASVQVLHDPPVRSDEVTEETPDLVLQPVKPKQRKMPRSELRDALVLRDGMFCQGCGWVPPRSDYLVNDHRHPHSDGGVDDIVNRVLLCHPCNETKSDTLTLKGLRQFNKRHGLMLGKVDGV